MINSFTKWTSYFLYLYRIAKKKKKSITRKSRFYEYWVVGKKKKIATRDLIIVYNVLSMYFNSFRYEFKCHVFNAAALNIQMSQIFSHTPFPMQLG